MKDYDEFQINLTLKFKIPKEEITINSVLYTVSQCSKEVDKAIAKALLAGIEEKAIAEKLKAEPGYALNGWTGLICLDSILEYEFPILLFSFSHLLVCFINLYRG